MSKNNCGRYIGIDALREYMTPDNAARAEIAIANLRGVFVYVFPYLTQSGEGNISLYARGEDYHRVIGRKLEKQMQALSERYPGGNFVPFVDASPFAEVTAAALAGLGVVGKNNLLITPRWGSYVFIGIIATDLERASEHLPLQSCIGCDACISACPGGALTDGGFLPCRCLSDITQRKGALTEREASLIRSCGTAWGCDICQSVCPMNKSAEPTDIAEFGFDLVCTLRPSDIPPTQAEFKRTYERRAFSWRGRAPIARNLELLFGESDGGQ